MFVVKGCLLALIALAAVSADNCVNLADTTMCSGINFNFPTDSVPDLNTLNTTVNAAFSSTLSNINCTADLTSNAFTKAYLCYFFLSINYPSLSAPFSNSTCVSPASAAYDCQSDCTNLVSSVITALTALCPNVANQPAIRNTTAACQALTNPTTPGQCTNVFSALPVSAAPYMASGFVPVLVALGSVVAVLMF